jgi:hypothetical protein
MNDTGGIKTHAALPNQVPNIQQELFGCISKQKMLYFKHISKAAAEKNYFRMMGH